MPPPSSSALSAGSFITTIAPDSNSIPYILGKALVAFLQSDPATRYRPGLPRDTQWTTLIRILKELYRQGGGPPLGFLLDIRAERAAFTLLLRICGNPIPPLLECDPRTLQHVLGPRKPATPSTPPLAPLVPQYAKWGLRPMPCGPGTLENILADLIKDTPAGAFAYPDNARVIARERANGVFGVSLAPEREEFSSRQDLQGENSLSPPGSMHSVAPSVDTHHNHRHKRRRIASQSPPSRSILPSITSEMEDLKAKMQNKHDGELLAVREKQLQTELEAVRHAKEMNERERAWLEHKAELEEMVRMLKSRHGGSNGSDLDG